MPSTERTGSSYPTDPATGGQNLKPKSDNDSCLLLACGKLFAPLNQKGSRDRPSSSGFSHPFHAFLMADSDSIHLPNIRRVQTGIDSGQAGASPYSGGQELA